MNTLSKILKDDGFKRILLGVLIGCTITVGAFGVRSWWRRYQNRPEPPPPRPPVGEISKVADNLYLVPQGGGNTAVFVTTEGVLLVDTKYPENWNGLLDQIKKVTDKPIKYVINTHCHNDHSGGNVFLPPGVEVIAQENTAKNLEEYGYKNGRVTRSFKDKMTLFSGPEEVDLYYFGPAHTDGDTFVVFREARVMHAGDVFPGKAAPIINIAWGGNGRFYSDTLAKAVSGIPNVDNVISGHSKIFPWNDFVDYAEFNRLLLNEARTESRTHHTPQQAAADLQLPSKFKDYSLKRTQATIGEIFRFFE